jgi:hypothetical protein
LPPADRAAALEQQCVDDTAKHVPRRPSAL